MDRRKPRRALAVEVIGLDTNVLLRWLIDETLWPEDSSGQMEAARRLIGSDETFFVNLIVLAETVWVLQNPLRQSKQVVVDVVERMLGAANVVIDQRDTVIAACAGYRAGKPGFADHLIGQTNRHAGCKTTVSFDKGTRRSDLFTRLASSDLR